MGAVPFQWLLRFRRGEGEGPFHLLGREGPHVEDATDGTTRDVAATGPGFPRDSGAPGLGYIQEVDLGFTSHWGI